jgi:hypothetical protein
MIPRIVVMLGTQVSSGPERVCSNKVKMDLRQLTGHASGHLGVLMLLFDTRSPEVLRLAVVHTR